VAGSRKSAGVWVSRRRWQTRPPAARHTRLSRPRRDWTARLGYKPTAPRAECCIREMQQRPTGSGALSLWNEMGHRVGEEHLRPRECRVRSEAQASAGLHRRSVASAPRQSDSTSCGRAGQLGLVRREQPDTAHVSSLERSCPFDSVIIDASEPQGELACGVPRREAGWGALLALSEHRWSHDWPRCAACAAFSYCWRESGWRARGLRRRGSSSRFHVLPGCL
jgi:hypothetical protein